MSVSPPSPPVVAQQSVAGTATVAMGMSGGACVLMWFFACIRAHEFISPDDTTIMVMSGAIAPIAHAIKNAIMSYLNRIVSVPVTTVAFVPTQDGATS